MKPDFLGKRQGGLEVKGSRAGHDTIQKMYNKNTRHITKQ